jgi:outer membrane protein TolC
MSRLLDARLFVTRKSRRRAAVIANPDLGMVTMLRPPRKLMLTLLCFGALTGCQPGHPIYLRDNGDLSHYIDQQVETAYPDVATASLEEVVNSHAPLTIDNYNIASFSELSLQDAMSIALQNIKVIRGYGTPGLQGNFVAPGVDTLSTGPGGAGTIYNVAIRETEPGFLTQPGQTITPSNQATNTSIDSNQGVESALAEFDAQYTSSLFYNSTDRPQNFAIANLDARQFTALNANYISELSKKSATGTQFFLRNTTDYTRNNNPLLAQGGAQIYRGVFTTAMEAEVRQPLLRGRGTFVNRMPVIMARIGGDQEVAAFESQLQNFVANVEIRYWNLFAAFHNFEAAKEGRDGAQQIWNIEKAKFEAGSSDGRRQGGTKQTVARAQSEYFLFQAEVERTFSELLDAESDLRYLMGWAPSDGQFIRPLDQPTTASISFEWCQVLGEALNCLPTLRQERWEIKKRELALQFSKNALLPQLDAVGLYRWLGLGDNLIGSGRSGNNFGNPAGANAWDELTEGDYQEFRFGVQYGVPIGFRRELANVRNAQLKLSREIARLEDMELSVTHDLSDVLRAINTNYRNAESHYNRWAAAETEVQSYEDLREAGEATVDVALEAQRIRAQARTAYYQSVVEYNKCICLLHHRKGTIGDYNGVQIGEGPWPSKAYYDASERARQAGASQELNYAFTRPGVVSLSEGHNGYEGMGEAYFGDDSESYSNEVIMESVAPAYEFGMPEIVDPNSGGSFEQVPPAHTQEAIPAPSNQKPSATPGSDRSTMRPRGFSMDTRSGNKSGTGPTRTSLSQAANGGLQSRLTDGLNDVDFDGIESMTSNSSGNTKAKIRLVNHDE